ncbi:syntaxin-8-like [Convolutriloba macropyga]|uniref:syntaxin-8-like n=1 Tax=Convolutriloba macropyga TaxID=536237 RepID=UPI003F51C6F1
MNRGFSDWDSGGGGGDDLFGNNRGTLTVDELRTDQQRVIQEQDRGLDAISQSLARTKRMAEAIGDEVDDQNDLIDDIKDKADTVQGKFQKENRHVNMVLEKSSTTMLWVIIIILFVVILLILIVF